MKASTQLVLIEMSQIISGLKRNCFNMIILLFVITATTANQLSAQNCNCKHVITAAQTSVDASKMDIQPGDTVCIEASVKRMLY